MHSSVRWFTRGVAGALIGITLLIGGGAVGAQGTQSAVVSALPNRTPPRDEHESPAMIEPQAGNLIDAPSDDAPQPQPDNGTGNAPVDATP